MERNTCDAFKSGVCKILKARGIKAVNFVVPSVKLCIRANSH